MKKKEQKWNTIFNQYLRQRKIYGFFELKQTDTDSIPFDCLEPSQARGLPACHNNGLVWKFSDQDQREKPCDCVSIPPLDAFVVIKFPDGFYVIRYFTFELEASNNIRKSLTKERAGEICEILIHI